MKTCTRRICDTKGCQYPPNCEKPQKEEKSMKITTKSTIKITIDGQIFELSKDEATELFNQLKKELGIVDAKYPPMQPYIPKDIDPIWPHPHQHPNTPMPWTFPTDPTYPSFPQIWCGQPSSTCNT